MNDRIKGIAALLAVTLLAGTPATARADDASKKEIQDLKRSVESLQRRVRELEAVQPSAPRAPAPTPATAAEPGAPRSLIEEEEAKFRAGEQSPVEYRGNFDDKQEAAPRPGDYTLDPQYRGFIPIPHTAFMIKFNPKPRVDFTLDSQNSGDDFRFVPAMIPLEGTADHGGGEHFNVNGNGTQLRVDMRAPALPGNLRFYYQNDFFGSDSGNFKYRLQHAYGQFYNIVAGFTYGVFEDPDAWPDTVDYEGPNAVIFARRPLGHYTFQFNKEWDLTVGVEDPDTFIDTSFDPTAHRLARAPDGGFNVRWEPGMGHMQFSSIFRSLGASGDNVGTDTVFGWGVNLSGHVDITKSNTLMAYVVYGHGVGGMGNDTSFLNSDAAFDSAGHLEALEYFSGLIGFTHRWTPSWRSTFTYGYANLGHASGQPGDAYDFTHYASGNVIYQLFKRMSVGFEVLYGFRQVHNGDNGDVIRTQFSLLYSLFD